MNTYRSGYYWFFNKDIVKGGTMCRPVLVHVLEEGTTYGRRWLPKGVYVQSIGSENINNISYWETFEGARFVPFEVPKE